MDSNRKAAAVLKNMGTANKLVEKMQSDIQTARQVVSGQFSRTKDLEELVHLLKEDNSMKKKEIDELKRALDDIHRNKILQESAIRVESVEYVRAVFEENHELKEAIRINETLRSDMELRATRAEAFNIQLNKRIAYLEDQVKTAVIDVNKERIQNESVRTRCEEAERHSSTLEISRLELLERVKSLEATLAQTTVEALKEQRHLIATMTGEYSSGASTVHSSLLIKSADSPKSGHVRVPSLPSHQSEGSGSSNNIASLQSDFVMNTSYLKALAGQYQNASASSTTLRFQQRHEIIPKTTVANPTLFHKGELPSSSSQGLARSSPQNAVPTYDESVVTLEDILNPRPLKNTTTESFLPKQKVKSIPSRLKSPVLEERNFRSPEESDNEFDRMDAYELGDDSNDEYYGNRSGDDSISENVVFYYEDLHDS